MKKLFAILCVLLISCVEELDIENIATEENAGNLVVEATFTDIMERQKVLLTRSVARLDVETDTTYFRLRPLGLGLQDSVEYEENANVRRTDGTSETVYGFVEATSTSERRIYLDYDDFFPGEELPPYPFPCFEESAPESHVSYCFTGLNTNQCPPSIIERVDAGVITYTGINNDNIGVCPGSYTFIARVCGDCTLLGENVAPDFWEE